VSELRDEVAAVLCAWWDDTADDQAVPCDACREEAEALLSHIERKMAEAWDEGWDNGIQFAMDLEPGASTAHLRSLTQNPYRSADQ
jgi:hypothetical protein